MGMARDEVEDEYGGIEGNRVAVVGVEVVLCAVFVANSWATKELWRVASGEWRTGECVEGHKVIRLEV